MTQSEFESLTWSEIDAYAARLRTSGIAGPPQEVLLDLLKKWEAYDPVRQMHLIRWALNMQLPGIEDIAVRFFEKEGDVGAQYTIINWLIDAPSLTASHVDRLARASTRIEAGDLKEILDRLRIEVRPSA